MRRAVKIYDWLGGDIYNLFSDSVASSIYPIPGTSLALLALHDLARSGTNCLLQYWYDLTVKTKVVIYSRPGCHLCEEAKEAMRAASCVDAYSLDEVNIENDPELLQRYREDIPVITINGVEAFRHRLSTDEFRKRILEISRS